MSTAHSLFKNLMNAVIEINSRNDTLAEGYIGLHVAVIEC